jgi:uncharacterized protein (UPF0179 family)
MELKPLKKRNIVRFEGDDFMFTLSIAEIKDCSRSQIVTLNKGRGYNIKTLKA